MKLSRSWFLSLLVGSTLSATIHADPVLDWNEALLQAARATGINPPAFSRAAAITHLAIFDAVNGIQPTHRPYHVSPAAPEGASVEAAVASAAFTAASALFPGEGVQETNFAVVYAASLAPIPEGQAKADGIAWGATVANAILELRSNDNSAGSTEYSVPPVPGVWRPTLPGNAGGLLPNWGNVTCFAMTSGDQFRPYAPPPVTSSSYALEVNMIKEYGSATSIKRNADQTEIALFWADGGGTETPPGHWNHIAQDVSKSRSLSLQENARLFALLNVAMADAAISSWDAKYAYNLWRPITAIREADTDENADTEADPNWLPLIATPPFPECTSGHSTFSRAGATVLAKFFGSDEVSFTTTSDALPGVTRSFTRFSAAAEEAGISRIYGGIHFQTANIGGQGCGFSIANHVMAYFLQSLNSPQFTLVGRNGGETELSLSVEPNRTYLIRASSDLKTWEDVATLSSTDGTIRFRDVNAGHGQLRFYSAVAE